MTRKKHRWNNCRQIRPLRRKPVKERETLADGTLLASRWRKFSRASSDLLDEAIAAASNRLASAFDRQLDGEDEQTRRVTWYSRVAWGRIIGWLLIILAPVALYHYWGPFRRVTRATYLASYKAIKRELPPRLEENRAERLGDAIESSISTVMPRDKPGAVYVQIMRWLHARRPRLDLKQRIDEIHKIDEAVTRDVRGTLMMDSVVGEELFKPGQTWAVTRASTYVQDGTTYLIFVLHCSDKRVSESMVYAVDWLDGEYSSFYVGRHSPLPEEERRETLESTGPKLMCSERQYRASCCVYVHHLAQ